jgi:hypothetical protein
VTECFSPQSPDPNRRPRTNRVSPAIQFGTVHLISKLPPSPLSHKALHAHCATPFRQRHNQPTPRPTILPIPSGSRSARCLHRYAPSFPTALPQPATLFITSSPRQPPASSLSLLYTHTHAHIQPHYTILRQRCCGIHDFDLSSSQTPLHAFNHCYVPSLRASHCIAPASLPAPSPQAILGLHSLADRIAPSSTS